MAGVSRDELEAPVADSPELWRMRAAQVAAAVIVRAAAARVKAPEHLCEALTEQRLAPAAIPPAPAAGSTCMHPHLPLNARLHVSEPGTPFWLATRVLGALATLAVGAVHLQQYFKLYSAVPTIGTLFVLNFIGATVIGLALLAPIERMAGRLGRSAVALLAAAGIGLAATSFVFLLISEQTPLFGFMEPGYDPAGIAAARVSEIATVVLLGAFLFARRSQHRRSS